MRSHASSTLVMALVALYSLAGCGDPKGRGDVHPVTSTNLPGMPTPLRGEATLSGKVSDAAGNPVQGATVKIAETDGKATTATDGTYQMTVPSDSTLTLVTTATGFANSARESIVVANEATVTGFDVFMLAAADVTRMIALGGGSATVPSGLMAVRLHSLSGTCQLTGAKVSVWPPKAATVMYSRPSANGGMDEPDAAMTSVQAGVDVDAWLASALPPGNMLRLTVEQTGCTLLSPSPSMAGVQYPGLRRVDASALSVADLFLN